MTNRENFTKEAITKLDDELLFTIFCCDRDCRKCPFYNKLPRCRNEFYGWLNEEAKEEQNDKS